MATYSFGNGLPAWNGVPMVSGLPITEGNYYFVDAGIGSDGNKGTSITKPFATYAKAMDTVTSNNNDVICLLGSGSHALAAMETVSKNRVHTVGLDGTMRSYGQGAKLGIGVTTDTADVGAILNTGVRNSWSNVKLYSNNTLTEGVHTFLDGGEYTVLENCEIYLSTQLSVTTAAELLMNGDSSQVRGCTIGSTANILTGTTIRPCVSLAKGTAGTGKVSRDVRLDDCTFWRGASHTTSSFVHASSATDVERSFVINNPIFFNTKLATATPAQCVSASAEQTQGYILINNPTAIACTKISTSTGVYIAGVVPTYATTGISLAS